MIRDLFQVIVFFGWKFDFMEEKEKKESVVAHATCHVINNTILKNPNILKNINMNNKRPRVQINNY